MWRCLLPSEEEGNIAYNNLIVELLSRDHYGLAIELTSFIMKDNKKVKLSQEGFLLLQRA